MLRGDLLWGWLAGAAWLGLCPAPAPAQPVFFDDFDGNALLPHWIQPPASDWQYNVSNGRLNVTNLLYPSSPISPGNTAVMEASFAPQMDFQLDARMGWGSAAGVARFELEILTPGGGIVGHLGYCELVCGGSGAPGIFGATTSGIMQLPSPPPGMYDFRVDRAGGQWRFYFEGNLFANLTSPYTGPIGGVGFFFSSPYPGQSGPFYVDRVQVVPAPGVLGAAALASILAVRRR